MGRIIIAMVLLMPAASNIRVMAGEIADLEMSFLGHRFIESIKDDNIAGYSQCWAPGTMVRRMVERYPDGPTLTEGDGQLQDETKAMKQEELKRDAYIIALFAPLRKELSKVAGGDLSLLTLESVRPERFERHDGFNTVGAFTLTYRINNKTHVELRMGDLITLGGQWYFCERPRNEIVVKRNGETAIVHMHVEPRIEVREYRNNEEGGGEQQAVRLWDLKTEKRGKSTVDVYSFDRNQLYVVLGETTAVIGTHDKEGVGRSPIIMMFWKSPDSENLLAEIVDPLGNNVSISMIFPKERILYSIEDQAGVPIVVLNQTGNSIMIGDKQDWLFVISQKKEVAKIVGDAWGAKQADDGLDELQSRVTIHFEEVSSK